MKVKEFIKQLEQLEPDKEIKRVAWEFCTYHEPTIEAETEIYLVIDNKEDEIEEAEWVSHTCSWQTILETKKVVVI